MDKHTASDGRGSARKRPNGPVIGVILEDHDAIGEEARRIDEQVQDAIGAMQDAVSEAADTVAATVSRIGDEARGAYGQATVRVQKVARQVDPFVKTQPYAALALAAVGGLMFGLLFAGRGPKIVYVRPRT